MVQNGIKTLKIHGQVQVYALYCDANQCWSVGQYNQFNIMSIVNDKMIISSTALKYCGTRPSNTEGTTSICILYFVNWFYFNYLAVINLKKKKTFHILIVEFKDKN